MVTTYPVRGGKPTVRKLVSGDPTSSSEFGSVVKAVEARDGTLYLEFFFDDSASGATGIYRVPPGPAGPVVPVPANRTYTEYAFTVDANSNYYLLQNRYWCADPSQSEGCLDDYGVDDVQRYTSSGAGPTRTAVTGVDLPVGGISVASTGAIYAAVLISRRALPGNSTAVPQLLRIDPAGGRPAVLAAGHFSQPVADDFRWYGR